MHFGTTSVATLGTSCHEYSVDRSTFALPVIAPKIARVRRDLVEIGEPGLTAALELDHDDAWPVKHDRVDPPRLERNSVLEDDLVPFRHPIPRNELA